MEKLRKGMEGEQIKHVQLPVTAKSGKKLFFDFSFSRIYKDGVVVGAQGTAVDITARKGAETALQESEIKYRTLFESANDAIFLMDQDIFIDCNQKTLEMFGCTREQIIGQPPYRFSPEVQPDGRNSTKEALEKINAANKGQPQFFEWKHCRYDGTLFDTEISLKAFNDEGKYIQAIVRDITGRKHAEFLKEAALEALRESEQFLRETQSIALMGGWKANPETDFLQWTEGVYRIIEAPLDYHPDLTEGMKYYTPATIEILKGRIMNTLTTNEPFAEECEIVTETGKKLWVEVRGLSHMMEGQTPCVIGTIQDITERKQAEEALKNSELKYRNIFENAIEGIYQSTIDGRFITSNAALARMAGYDSPEELIASIKDIGTQLYVRPEDRERFMEIRDAKGFVEGFEVEFYKKDGSKFWVVINARAVKDEQGKILYFEGLIEDITIRKHAEKQLQQTLKSLRKAVGTTIQVLMSAIESRDSYTSGHQSRSADLACAIAKDMGLTQDKIEGIRMAGSIHDIGKLSVPAEILSKPTKLTDIEFSLIKEHSRCGYGMLKDVESPWPLAEIVHQHHERMNGSGYPRSLKGDEILMEARILAVADVVEAMASHRPYRPTLGIEAALEEIEKNKGILYDNTVANTCLRLFRDKGFQLT
jgi:PAS domain S-box-containing protein